MDQTIPTQSTPQLPRYRRVEQRAMPVAIQARDLLLLKTIYDFPYCTALQLSRLLPAGPINPQLRAYHDQRHLKRAREEVIGGQASRIRLEILRRLQQLVHAEGGTYVQR